MELVRTTIRIPKDLKKEIQKKAIKDNKSFQDIVNEAVWEYVNRPYQRKPIKIKFANLHLGGINKLTREDIYGTPNFDDFS
jgi:hypothetical protein